MKKFLLIFAIALIASATTVNAQCSKTCGGSKQECAKAGKKTECKADATKANAGKSITNVGAKTDSKNASCEKKCASTCTDKNAKTKGTASAKCDTTMCKKGSAGCKDMKNCSGHK